VGTNTKEKEEFWFVITKNKENWSCEYSKIPPAHYLEKISQMQFCKLISPTERIRYVYLM
jgi:hypothetical protein